MPSLSSKKIPTDIDPAEELSNTVFHRAGETPFAKKQAVRKAVAAKAVIGSGGIPEAGGLNAWKLGQRLEV
ncbi:MAG: hypothetical protein V6Z86_03340 [Hyphomicrobiales bacterium]